MNLGRYEANIVVGAAILFVAGAISTNILWYHKTCELQDTIRAHEAQLEHFASLLNSTSFRWSTEGGYQELSIKPPLERVASKVLRRQYPNPNARGYFCRRLMGNLPKIVRKRIEKIEGVARTYEDTEKEFSITVLKRPDVEWQDVEHDAVLTLEAAARGYFRRALIYDYDIKRIFAEEEK